ncbi:hypothetical protein BFP70_18910 [Thioclava sp. SK-1]|uniref:FadR/GntR family transcriptional regulator n=1 Tax=Thioclava sp. SK-1 TaxID=1889770 RepID=UPI00082497FC|nr:FadR/GntR family transcriptional regulator [Thioclava sp. SK-1]OCX58136.1 hypothetical protein BFP70_18910 [Thioclava sp. SK-1]
MEAKETGLVDRVIDDLLGIIRAENLRVGDPLPSEQALATRLAVSRTVAREAMRALSALGVLQIGNGRRARVAAPNAGPMSILLDHTVYTGQQSLQQVIDVRRTLELRTAGLAALRRSDDQARRLLELIDQMYEALEHDHQKIMDYDIAFHTLIAQASGNALYALLVSSYEVITRQTWDIGWRARANDHNRRENIDLHGRIATAIMMQDSARAEAEMTAHFDSAIAVLMRAGVT